MMASDPLDQLQSMFPTIEGDVIAIVFNESEKDGEFFLWVWQGLLLSEGIVEQ